MHDCLRVCSHMEPDLTYVRVQVQSHEGFKGMTDLSAAFQCSIRQLINSHENWVGDTYREQWNNF